MGNSSSSDEDSPPSPSGYEGDDRNREEGAEEGDDRNLSYWEMAKVGYQELVNAIIRPPRAMYEDEHLGPECFEWHQKFFRRNDLELVNPRGQRLKCSHWYPIGDDVEDAPPRPCLIYLHGNSSARLEAISQLSLCLSIGISLFAFDFAGSGLSDGEWVSLGYWERDDLATVVEHLRQSGRVTTIALWGRSMGAVCALMHSHRDPSIAAIICDSAFSDLSTLAEELVDRAKSNGLMVPGFIVSIALRMVRSSVLKTANFKIEDVSAIKECDTSYVPIVFFAAKDDDFIAPHHSQELYDKYGSEDKNIVFVEGDHNSPRPGFLYDSARNFLYERMAVSDDPLPGSDPFNGGVPPWMYTNTRGLNLADLGLEPNDLFANDVAGRTGANAGLAGMTPDREERVQEAITNVFGYNNFNTTTHTTDEKENIDDDS